MRVFVTGASGWIGRAVVSELMRHYGHNLMGIYAEVIAAGPIAVGDRLTAD